MPKITTPKNVVVLGKHGEVRPLESRVVFLDVGGGTTDVTSMQEYAEQVWSHYAAGAVVGMIGKFQAGKSIAYSRYVPSLRLQPISGVIEIQKHGQPEVRHLPAPIDDREKRIRELELERDELKLENQLLQSRVAEERRATARETRQYDQLLIEFNTLQQHNDNLLNCSKAQVQAIDATTALLLRQQNAQLRMIERYEGVVEHVHGDNVIVVFEIDDDVVEHRYDRKQFIDGQLPEQGDHLTVFVHVVHNSVESEDVPSLETDEADEYDYERSSITGPFEF